jgi:ankyrin repeat protein
MARKGEAVLRAKPHPNDLYGQLLYAMWRDSGALQRHLAAGRSIHDTDEVGATVLHVSCSSDVEAMTKGSDTLVKQLLQAGADPNSRNGTGSTPLMLTSSPEVANCLLDNGADIKGMTVEGSTALKQASARGSIGVVKVLLRRGALEQMLKVSKSGHTPLSAAVNNCHEEVTILLLQELIALQSGFDINHPRLAANQPLLCCAATGNFMRVAEFALDHGADLDITGPNGPPLILAAKTKHHSMVDLLCQRGASVQVRFGARNSLDEAVLRRDAKSVKTLIKHGADVNVTVAADSEYPVAVLQAAALGDFGIIQLLLDAGATLDAALQYEAVTECCRILDDAAAAKVVKLLLPHCTSFASSCELGGKMLAYAVWIGRLQVAKLLHAAGADVHRTDENGTLIHGAAVGGNLARVKWLQSLGLDARAVNANSQLSLHWACLYKHSNLVKYFLSLPGAAGDIHARTSKGHTPLHLAALYAADSVVQLLLQRGADANARDITGCTPLMLASSLLVVKVLLAAGADATAVDSTGMTVLQCQARRGACAGVVCLLLKAGADPTATLMTDGTLVTAAHAAGINGHFALEALLSRAADDYRKKHSSTSNAAVDSSSNSNSNSDSSSGSVVSGAERSSSVEGAAAAATDSSTATASSSYSDTHTATTAETASITKDNSSSSSNDAAHSVDAHSAAAQQQQQQQMQQQQCKARKAKQPCAICSKPTTKLCRRCAAVYYCSIICQKACFADAQHRAQCEAKAAEIV